ncbi:MAG TPA: lactate utilization protein C [Burkholderiales bacterium]|nr:lactate utilization protein C [Burkholderiales bacterium]
MSARSRILERIRAQQDKGGDATEHEVAAVRAYIDSHPRSPAPRNDWEPVAQFCERARALATTLDEAPALNDVPALVASYLREHALPLRAVCWRELGTLDWRSSGVEVETRAAADGDLVGITGAYCAIGETGTLMTLSGPHTPPSVSLLPETHIAVVARKRVMRSMEDAWALLRGEHRFPPRAVNFISGPSRTADIEQTVTLGAHGPYRVHVILVGA